MTNHQAAVAIRAFILGFKEIRANAREQGLGSAESLSFRLQFLYENSSGEPVEVASEPFASFQDGNASVRDSAMILLREVIRLCPEVESAEWESACREAVVGGVMHQ